MCSDFRRLSVVVKILALTDSLSERAGGLSHATMNLACSSAQKWPAAEFVVMAQKDHAEIQPVSRYMPNLKVHIEPCFRNQIFPWSKGLQQAIAELNPDLIHLRGIWRQPSLVSLQWKQCNPAKPLIVQTAGMLEPWARSRRRWLKSAYYSLIERQLIAQCDLIHATSQQEAKTLESLGIDSSRIALVEEGVFLPPASSLHSSEGKLSRKLLYLSRLHPVKGLELLLEALSMLRPRGWICEIVGMGHPIYERQLMQQVSRLHLEDYVHFRGPLSGEAKNRALAEADAFILPSFSESFGIAIAEAMSWALPVITTTATPWRVLSDQEMGWCVDPSLNALSQALFNLFQCSDDRLQLMGARSRQYIAERYDWMVISQKMASIYQSLLAAS